MEKAGAIRINHNNTIVSAYKPDNGEEEMVAGRMDHDSDESAVNEEEEMVAGRMDHNSDESA